MLSIFIHSIFLEQGQCHPREKGGILIIGEARGRSLSKHHALGLLPGYNLNSLDKSDISVLVRD